MHPKLFEIPFVHLTVWTYGLMMVIGFVAAIGLIKYMSRDITPNSHLIANAALYALIAGVVGARLFYVVHYFEQFQGSLLSVFAIWQGGLELLGGAALAIPVIIFYLWRNKLPVRQYLDILAVGLMLALAFGRIGCFLRGCCFGRPTDLPWAVSFPYDSDAYHSQIYPNPKRGRPQPQLKLPIEYFGYFDGKGIWQQGLKPYEYLNDEQKRMVDDGPYCCLPVHPTQLYSSANAAALCLVLYLFWRRGKNGRRKLFAGPGCTFSLMFILYGIGRFFIEFVRDDNPIEFDGLTVSQNISIALVVLGVVLMVVFEKMKVHES